MASTAGAAVGRLEVVEAGRSTDVKLRPVFASGLPGPSYGQKTNSTSGDLWVWASVTSYNRWVWAVTSDDLLQSTLLGALDNLVARGNRCWLGLG